MRLQPTLTLPVSVQAGFGHFGKSGQQSLREAKAWFLWTFGSDDILWMKVMGMSPDESYGNLR